MPTYYFYITLLSLFLTKKIGGEFVIPIILEIKFIFKMLPIFFLKHQLWSRMTLLLASVLLCVHVLVFAM